MSNTFEKVLLIVTSITIVSLMSYGIIQKHIEPNDDDVIPKHNVEVLTEFGYYEHDYIVFEYADSVNHKTISIVHNPDCNCHKKH